MSLSSVCRSFGLRPAGDALRGQPVAYREREFNRILARERSRVERSNYRFSLVTFAIDTAHQKKEVERRLFKQLQISMRTTDEVSWIKQDTIGVILHNATEKNAWKFADRFIRSLVTDGALFTCKVHAYPPKGKNDSTGTTPPNIDSTDRREGKAEGNADSLSGISQFTAQKISGVKRAIDIIGSLSGLVLLGPVFFLIWLMIRIISPGPAIYKQIRVGRGGKLFTFWKFRTMKINAETSSHRQYLSELIHCEQSKGTGQKPMLKLDQDNCNIIPFGKVLRRTCLDELPQLINVLKGDMSLIGPRPPIPYEVEEYKLWHNGRLDVVPGMTGLWQVSGKNRLSFEQMVRLDIQYIRQQSLWLDLKILLLTPIAIANEIGGGLRRLGRVFINEDEAKLA